MSTHTGLPPKRRFAIVLGVVAVLIALAVPAEAEDGQPVILGQTNEALLATSIERIPGSLPGPAFVAKGQTGVIGEGTQAGLLGFTYKGDGVVGEARTHRQFGQGNNGVAGFSENRTASGVYGENPNGSGVSGQSLHNTGVRGEGKARGVYGLSFTGDGVVGEAGASRPRGKGVNGVVGLSQDEFGSGVVGANHNGTGVKAVGRTGLDVQGLVKLDRAGFFPVEGCPGAITVYGHEILPNSMVIVTLQGREGRTPQVDIAWPFITPGPAGGPPDGGSFTVHFTKWPFVYCLNQQLRSQFDLAFVIVDQGAHVPLTIVSR